MADVTTYRSFLQGLANNGDTRAEALLQVVGDDTGVNQNFMGGSNNLYSQNDGGATYNLTPSQVSALNTQYIGGWNEATNMAVGAGNGGGGGGSGSGGSGRAAAAPFNPAPYDQAISNTNQAIGRLGTTLNSGNSGIDAAYQDALSKLTLAKNQGQATYDTNKHSTATDFVGAKNTIGSQAGQQLNSLQRLLGSRGAGGGSAYNISAPDAVARQATLQRTDAGNAFSKNNQSLDTNWNNFLTGNSNEVASATGQRDEQKSSLNQSIATKKADLLQSLAKLTSDRAAGLGGNGVVASQPIYDQANSVLNGAADYTVKPINYNTTAYQAPSLASYTTNPAAAPTYNGQSAGNDFTSPYLAALLGKKQQPAGV